MKIISLFLGLVAYAIISTLIRVEGGITLGGIPTVLLLGGCIGLAEIICKLYNKENGGKKN